MAELAACYRQDESVVSRAIAGETILVPIRQNVGDLDSIYTLNETGARIWELMDGQRSLEAIRDQIAAEYDVGHAEAARDVLEMADQLEAVGAVKKS